MKNFCPRSHSQTKFIYQSENFGNYINHIEVKKNTENQLEAQDDSENIDYLEKAKNALWKEEFWTDVTNEDVLNAFNKACEGIVGAEKTEALNFLAKAIGFPPYDELVTLYKDALDQDFSWPPVHFIDTDYGFITTQSERKNTTDAPDNTIDEDYNVTSTIYVDDGYFNSMQSFISKERNKNKASVQAAEEIAKTNKKAAKTKTKKQKKTLAEYNNNKTADNKTEKDEAKKDKVITARAAKKTNNIAKNENKDNTKEHRQLNGLQAKIIAQKEYYNLLLELHQKHIKFEETESASDISYKPVKVPFLNNGILLKEYKTDVNVSTIQNFTAVGDGEIWGRSIQKDNKMTAKPELTDTNKSEISAYLKELANVSTSLKNAYTILDKLYGAPYRRAVRRKNTHKENLKDKERKEKTAIKAQIDREEKTITKYEGFQDVLTKAKKLTTESSIGIQSLPKYRRPLDTEQ